MTDKEQFESLMNELADAINELAGTSGKKSISELIEIVRGLIDESD